MSERTSELENDVEEKRRELEATLEAIRTKLSTGQILDSAVRSLLGASGQGGTFVKNLGRQVSENPIPVALTGLGIAWLLSAQSAPRRREQSPDTFDRAQFDADEAEFGAAHAIAELRAGRYDMTGSEDPSGEPAGAPYDKRRLTSDAVNYGAAYAADQMKSGAYAVADAAAQALDRSKDAATAARSASVQAGRSLNDFVAEEPLLAGAIGIAIGAAIGAALPATSQEDRLLGRYRDKLRDGAAEYAATQTERAEQAVTEAFKPTPPKEDGSAK